MSSGNAFWNGIFSRTAGQSLQDAERIYLLANGGISGNNADMWRQALTAFGLTGSLYDMKKAWIEGGAVFAPPPAHLVLDGAGYADCDNISGQVADDLKIVFRLQHPNWAPSGAQAIFTKSTSSPNYGFLLYLTSVSRFQFSLSQDGSAPSHAFSADVNIDAGETWWIKIEHDGLVSRFYKSETEGDWAQIGGDITHVRSGVHEAAGIAPSVASKNGSNILPTGKLHRYKMNDLGTDAALIDFNPSGHAGESSWLSDTGETWTLQGGASVAAD